MGQIIDRLREPSSWAGVVVVFVSLGVMVDAPLLCAIAIAPAIASIFVRELTFQTRER